MGATTTVSTRIDIPLHVHDCAPPALATRRTFDGKVCFENGNYRITAGDDNEVRILNKNTGESYCIRGDPHVEIDGRHAFDLWGRTTFMLEDGTKVTIVTTPWAGGDNGDHAAHITGDDGRAAWAAGVGEPSAVAVAAAADAGPRRLGRRLPQGC